jgi:hypothetical protein
LLESNASEFRVKEGNIFVAAADSGLFGVIAPTDEEYIIVNADDDRFPPTNQIILLVKARCKNQ